MIFPNIAAMNKWSNNYVPGAPSGSQDYVQLIRQSDGTILGWIDEDGIPRGSLFLGGGFGETTPFGELVEFSGTVGELENIPNGSFFQLYKNGTLLNPFGTPALTNVFLNSSGVSWQLVISGTGESATLAITEVSFNPSYPASVRIQSPNGTFFALSIAGGNLAITEASPALTLPIILADNDGEQWQLTIDNTGEFLGITEVPYEVSTPDYILEGATIILAIPATSFDVFVSYYSYGEIPVE